MPLFQQLPANVESKILGLLTPNEIACTVRGLSKDYRYAAEWRSCVVVRLSRPVPQHAFSRQWGVDSPALRFLTLEKRRELLRLTASSGVLENLVLALGSAGCLLTARLGLMEAAAAAGHLHICLWLRDRGLPWGNALNEAARAGWRNVCEQLVGLGCVPTLAAAESAVEGGHVGLMDWLLALLPRDRAFFTWLPRFAVAAASGCDLAAMQRLLTVWLPAMLQDGAARDDVVEPWGLLELHVEQKPCVVAAASSPTPDWRSKVEWLEGLFPDLPRPECSGGADVPDMVERLTWLRGRGYPVGMQWVRVAAREGNIAALTYLLDEAGVWVGSDTYDPPTEYAASEGHLAALQLLVARGCTVDAREAIREAAVFGHLAVVAWLVGLLRLEVSELGARVMKAAAMSGSVELLGWLRERGRAWTDGTFAGAANGGCEAALDWLVEHGCPREHGAEYYNVATKNGDLATVRCLRRLGVRWGPDDAVTSKAVRQTPLAMLRWLVETAGVSVNWAAALQAADQRWDLERETVRDWLREGKRRQEGAVPPRT